MSIKDKLLAKTGDLTLPPVAPTAAGLNPEALPSPQAGAAPVAAGPVPLSGSAAARGSGPEASTATAPFAADPPGARDAAEAARAGRPVAVPPATTAIPATLPTTPPALAPAPGRAGGSGALPAPASFQPPAIATRPRQADAADAPAAAVAPRTGPGQMLQFRGQMLAAEGELNRLRTQLQQHEGALPTRALDPRLLRPSRWANRHPDAFASAEFNRLKQDIELAGGNVQPIRVRPLPAQAEAEGPRYEVIFGHRRHRACLELGLPVLATIDVQPVSDLELFAAMDRENRERADLSPYEQGLMYRRALDEQLYPSNRRLAEALGVSHTWVANVLAVADLPPPVVECFRSPLEIQHRHARALAQALERDRKAVLRRAEKLRQQSPRPAAAQVLAWLLGEAPAARQGRAVQPLALDGHSLGHWRIEPDGGLSLHLRAEAIGDRDPEALVRAMARALKNGAPG